MATTYHDYRNFQGQARLDRLNQFISELEAMSGSPDMQSDNQGMSMSAINLKIEGLKREADQLEASLRCNISLIRMGRVC